MLITAVSRFLTNNIKIWIAIMSIEIFGKQLELLTYKTSVFSRFKANRLHLK